MKNTLATIAALLLASFAMLHAASATKPNIVFICADDLNFDSVGCYGCKIPGLTPNIDKLAAEGMRFQYAYATIAVCQPVRENLRWNSPCHAPTGRSIPNNSAPGETNAVFAVGQFC